MPNWCCSKIIIKGESLNEFKKTLNTKNEENIDIDFSFYQTIPRPEDCTNWNEWNIEHWGTKWDCKTLFVDYDDKTISIICDTAWSPPIAWAENCIKKFKDLSIEIGYSEGGMQYFGVWKDNHDTHYEFDENDVIYDDDKDEEIYSKRLQDHLDHYGIFIGG